MKSRHWQSVVVVPKKVKVTSSHQVMCQHFWSKKYKTNPTRQIGMFFLLLLSRLMPKSLNASQIDNRSLPSSTSARFNINVVEMRIFELFSNPMQKGQQQPKQIYLSLSFNVQPKRSRFAQFHGIHFCLRNELSFHQAVKNSAFLSPNLIGSFASG